MEEIRAYCIRCKQMVEIADCVEDGKWYKGKCPECDCVVLRARKQ